MELVCFQGQDKENWAQLNALVKRGDWSNVLIIKNKNSEDFPLNDKCKVIEIDANNSLLDIKKELIEKLSGALSKDFEVALSIASGTGKEHMALISALLSIPVGIRLVAFTRSGIEFIN